MMAADITCQIDPNPDIIGVGVRVSLYVLSLSSSTLGYIFRSVELSNAIESSLGVTGLALFLATVITTARNSLALFHILCVLHLLGIAGITIRPKGRYPAGEVRTVAFSAFYTIAGAGSLSFLIFVFATAPSFGNQPECNNRTVYVLMGVSLAATNSVLRWIFVAVLSILLVSLTIWLFVLCCMSLDYVLGRKPTNMAPAPRVEPSQRHERKNRGSPYHLASQLVGTIYLIIMLELMINRNPLAPGVGEWTFGQVLAMMMLIGPLIELVSLIIGRVDDGPGGQHTLEMTIARRQLEGA